MTWKAVFFDLDNTLYSHEKAFEAAIEWCYKVFIRKKVVDHECSFTKFFKVFKKNCDIFWPLYEQKKLSRVEYKRVRFNETMKSLHLPFDEKDADLFHQEYEDVVGSYSEAYPGLYDLFTFLNTCKIKYGIITNGNVKVQNSKMNKLKLRRWIPEKYIFISEQIGFHKPDYRLFSFVKESVNMKNEECIYIGDSWSQDVVGAKNAGWDAIFLNTRNEERKTDHEVIKELYTLHDVKNYFFHSYKGSF
ncbi:HAD-superfamily hydrolase, subfamily IA, variant 1 [Evansella cellulosilytica DSM 2522]|uniref:HAD-superfamily hydrolase, subfamily IA, variant 1 n=1 Tax=Evansella cellulosilytica (strain ATCC 21833 / DSM 2522 / FERM P-1141 / JCM 9156 / N-4) TaxID=649639 RepID=E6TWX1_EVAC2|nr:HAD-superfamily hydrolase, subfamily IA, variant 1 [Evansella cellulosilytica DSM 2522]